jgi:hypothetical protein
LRLTGREIAEWRFCIRQVLDMSVQTPSFTLRRNRQANRIEEANVGDETFNAPMMIAHNFGMSECLAGWNKATEETSDKLREGSSPFHFRATGMAWRGRHGMIWCRRRASGTLAASGLWWVQLLVDQRSVGDTIVCETDVHVPFLN